MLKETAAFIRDLYQTDDFIPLHVPNFRGNEKRYLNEAIDSTFVSSVGKFVNRFEDEIANYCGVKRAVATSNGTAGLHAALHAIGVKQDREVLTQGLTFVASCNAINYCGAKPVFIDVCEKTLGMCADSLARFLEKQVVLKDGKAINRVSGNEIAACLPMHTFGFPIEIDRIAALCIEFNIALIEDAAESIGSIYKEKACGSFGKLGVLSFNGNKIITAGGGGCILTNDENLANHLKHITTTAKKSHSWHYEHDELGFNYRMPNLNAALICAQLERLDEILENKRKIASKYQAFFKDLDIRFRAEQSGTKANYWLMTLQLNDANERDEFLNYMNNHGIMCRPPWNLMQDLNMYSNCQVHEEETSRRLFDQLVNIPSSPVYID